MLSCAVKLASVLYTREESKREREREREEERKEIRCSSTGYVHNKRQLSGEMILAVFFQSNGNKTLFASGRF